MPKRHAGDPRLASWCSRQRQQIKRGSLSFECSRVLSELGFISRARPEWESSFEELCKYKQDMGHCDVPRIPGKRTLALGRWLFLPKAPLGA